MSPTLPLPLVQFPPNFALRSAQGVFFRRASLELQILISAKI
jgi:hypothetical protein